MKFLQLMLCILAFESNAGGLVRLTQPFYGDYAADYQIVGLLLDNYFKAQVDGLQYAVLYARKKNQNPLDIDGNVVIKEKKKIPLPKKGTSEIGRNFIFATPKERQHDGRVEHAEYNILKNIRVGHIVHHNEKADTKYYLYSYFSPCCTINRKWNKYYQFTTVPNVPYCAFFSCSFLIREMLQIQNIPLTVGFSRVFGVEIPNKANTVFKDAEYLFYLGMITIISSNKAKIIWMREEDADTDWFQLQLLSCLDKVKNIRTYFQKEIKYPLRKFVNILTWHCLRQQKIGYMEMSMFKGNCFKKSALYEKGGVFEILSPHPSIHLETAVDKCYKEIEENGHKTLGPALNSGDENADIPSSLYNDYIGYYYKFDGSSREKFYNYENLAK